MENLKENFASEPKILVIGLGGGGNNALDRMIRSNIRGVDYVAMNTDIQVLNECTADIKIQLGRKITKGFGAGSDANIGETAALENEEEIKELIKNYDLCIITCGLGGGTGTGAAPVVSGFCQELDILTVAVVTIPFSFESTPRITAANQGLGKLEENVDTLLSIPNDKLLNLSDKPLLLEDAFVIADSVLKYTIEGITNIIYNKGMINLDFNDLKTTLAKKGIGHLGIGIVDTEMSILEAVKQAVNSPLLDTSIQGASNLLINTCGSVNISDLNEAVSYVRELAGEHVNIIWGTVFSTDYDENKIVVTLIATGMNNTKSNNSDIPIIQSSDLTEWIKKPVKIKPTYSPQNITIPKFILDSPRRKS